MQCLHHYKTAYPELAAQFEAAISGELPAGWDADLPFYTTADKPVSTRVASGNALNGLARTCRNLVGGSADLESSTMTHLKGIANLQRRQLCRPQRLLRCS